MNPTRKMWISAGVVGVVLVGGVSVAAAATAGRIEKVNQETTVVTTGQDAPRDAAEPMATPTPEDYVVSEDVNPDPEGVAEYWDHDRLEDADPMPMPMVTFSPNGSGE